MRLFTRSDAKLKIAAIFLLCGIAASSPAQTFTTLLDFNGPNGVSSGALIQGYLDGNLYGTTVWGGANNSCPPFIYGCGSVFKMTPAGVLTTLYNFSGPDGFYPSGLMQGNDGDFYGTTYFGGIPSCPDRTGGCGTIFKITPGGKLTTLHRFTLTSDGAHPFAGLIQATNGDFYGTTVGSGGPNCVNHGTYCGTIFKITPSGTLTTLYVFTGLRDGAAPYGGLVQAVDTDLYGTTMDAGRFDNQYCGGNCGTIFKINPEGSFTLLHRFNGSDGASPQDGLMQAADGDFYGTTLNGSTSLGTVFRMSRSGELTTLYSFGLEVNDPDGGNPVSGLIQASDGNFYGATTIGGSNSCLQSVTCGTVFKLTPAGTLTTLHSFSGPDGATPASVLLQATNGNVYGSTGEGGSKCPVPNGCGTIFKLSEGLDQIVKTAPTHGQVGAAVRILGDRLTGATSVTFNGTSALFEMISAFEIRATVPTGASTGPVEVMIPGRRLTSNVVFRVTP